MEKLFSLFSTSAGSAGGSSSAPAATVSDIFVYPIKSCRGISVPEAPITSTGFRWDRQWMVVNSNGRAFTQRVEPKLALVEPELPPGAFDFNWKSSDSSYMVLRAPDMDPLKVCLNRECNVVDGISVWEWSGTAFDEGDEASEWFTKYLGKPSRLVRFNTPSESRFVDPDYAQGYTAMFSDGYPYLVISQGSLDFLNELLKEPLPINRFRPNILVDGCAPFSEDLWKVTKLNNIAFHGVKLCARCKVPTINQESGTGGTEPTETLMKFRTDKALKRGKINKAKVYFGMNFVCAESLSAATLKEKVVKIGDPIHVLQSYASPADAAA
ncbi:mitochondrial amidoxime reducing component 2 [Phalaenopsis equestris]|uniref:mitochondrial amidoxime reducing component 2 n=1 Tax=Phalaenopsis equestris TaxID=78828 RepID=UPI0009E65ED5|nr:mitochondrial amidoxime reducing component 2 [Phalaenopsis equestris]XP_020576735.1 mitochondrial amidoxime reducing component 2 [Phalaenopsis equestris]XP_020576736.1 mitochondrial amidoxime reducing component 2 [Phalaenopsis equestris]